MKFKTLLLTPLLFAQMWVGAGVLPLAGEVVLDVPTNVTLRVYSPDVISFVKEDNKLDLIYYLFSLLIGIIILGKKYLVKNKVILKFHKKHIYQYFKDKILNRIFSKSKNSYYWHFYSALNLVKSA